MISFFVSLTFSYEICILFFIDNKIFEKYEEGTGSMDILQIDKISDQKKQNKMWMGGKHKAYEQKQQWEISPTGTKNQNN